MTEAAVYIRSATAEDAKQIKENIRHTLASPDGRAGRRSYAEAAARHELLVLDRFDSRERVHRIVGFIEWHTRVDGGTTIRDAGTVGEEPQSAVMKTLIREMLRLANPTSLQVKVREDLKAWNEIFAQIPGFTVEGREYSRPYWRIIWQWSPGAVERSPRRTPTRRPSPPRGRRR